MDNNYVQNLFSLDGKKAVITGSSQGIGKAAAVSLARFGAEVAVLGRNMQEIHKTVLEILAFGGKAEGFSVDVSNHTAIDTFMDQYLGQHGTIDIFVNNAAYTIMKPVMETSLEEARALYETNFMGCLHFLQRVGDVMKKNHKGNIVIVTSVNAVRELPGQGIYSTTKCGLEGLMHCAAADLTRYGIRVNSCAPGCIDTAMNKDFLDKEESREILKGSIPMGRAGNAGEIGNVIACMVTDAFSYMSGSTVVADGGLLLRCE